MSLKDRIMIYVEATLFYILVFGVIASCSTVEEMLPVGFAMICFLIVLYGRK